MVHHLSVKSFFIWISFSSLRDTELKEIKGKKNLLFSAVSQTLDILEFCVKGNYALCRHF